MEKITSVILSLSIASCVVCTQEKKVYSLPSGSMMAINYNRDLFDVRTEFLPINLGSSEIPSVRQNKFGDGNHRVSFEHSNTNHTFHDVSRANNADSEDTEGRPSGNGSGGGEDSGSSLSDSEGSSNGLSASLIENLTQATMRVLLEIV